LIHTIDRYEHGKFLIERFDHYYDSINGKGAFYIGIETFIFGGLIAGYAAFADNLPHTWLFWALVFSIFTCCIASIIFTILSIKPYSRDNHSNDQNPSLVYFGGIAKHEGIHFKEKFLKQSEDQILNDVVQQVHSLAKGLVWKFRKLRLASILLLIQFFLMIPIFIFFIKNYTK